MKKCPLCGKVCKSARGYQVHYEMCKHLPSEQDFRELLDRGLTQDETLTELGISQPTLYTLQKRYGIEVDWMQRSRWNKERVKGSWLTDYIYDGPDRRCNKCRAQEFCQKLLKSGAGFVLCERLEYCQVVQFGEKELHELREVCEKGG